VLRAAAACLPQSRDQHSNFEFKSDFPSSNSKMKLQWLCLVLLLACLATAEASKRKGRKNKKNELPVESKDVQDAIDILLDDEAAAAVDACARKHCGAGRECRVNEEGKAECRCVAACPEEKDPRRMICSNQNETWNSDCDLYRMRCLCKEGSEDCVDPKYDHAHVEYFGTCKNLPECTADEMMDFPRRMRDWLFNIMRDLADRHDLSPHFLKLEREAEKDLSRKWANAAIWKFCDLDGHPPDRKVSRHELFPIRAPLMALEHCIGPFLDSCDVDDDHFITLNEWGTCLGLTEEEIEDKCEEVRDENENQI